jgi:hypothetical protein
MDFMIFLFYRRFVPKISRILSVKCLKFGKFLLIY